MSTLPFEPSPSSSAPDPGRFHVLVSPSAAERLAYARSAVSRCSPGSPVLIVGASRGAADDLARDIAVSVPATFGVQRLSLMQLAARTALAALANEDATPSTWLGAEAVAARTVFDATNAGALRYFAPVASTPGFPRALARTLQELRLAGVVGHRLSPFAPTGPDLAWLLERFDSGFADASSLDRADLFRTAAKLLRETAPPGFILLLDIAIEDAAGREFVEALAERATTIVATVPHGDRDTMGHFSAMGAAIDERPARGTTDLALLRRFLFNTSEEPPRRTLDGSLEFFSAPGEGRECVEIARRILEHARSGVGFDEMAILVRTPQNYFGLLEHALKRAGIEAWFDRGTKRPHPAGRAFLALLACAAEHLSAARFAEYLAPSQVPDVPDVSESDRGSASDDDSGRRSPPHNSGEWVAPQDEAFGLPVEPPTEDDDDDDDDREAGSTIRDPQSSLPDVVGGTLRAPWRWEKFLVEAAVIGRDAARWKRRLAGKAAELARQITEAERREGADSGLVAGLRRTSEQLEHLRAFAV